jgi:hypothetical protein
MALLVASPINFDSRTAYKINRGSIVFTAQAPVLTKYIDTRNLDVSTFSPDHTIDDYFDLIANFL